MTSLNPWNVFEQTSFNEIKCNKNRKKQSFKVVGSNFNFFSGI